MTKRLAIVAAALFSNVAGAQGPVARADRHLAERVRRPAVVANRRLQRTAAVIDFAGGPGVFMAGGGLYLAGRVGDRPRLTDLGLYTTEAALAGSLVTGVLKAVIGRARPYVSADTNPRDFGFMRGWRDDAYRSLPSGHTTAAFSFAAAASAELSRTRPRAADVAAPLLYAGATLVGLTRMYKDKHWASDVVLGAVVGVLAGVTTVRWNHDRRP